MRDVLKSRVASVEPKRAAALGAEVAPPARPGGARFSVTKHGDGELGSLSLVMPASEECALGRLPRARLLRGAD